MAIYLPGASTDVADLLTKLRAFCQANGFNINYFGARSSGSGQALQVTKGSLVGTFLADSSSGTASDPGPFLGTYCHNAYNVANGTESQLGGAAKTLANNVIGAFQAHHFFCNSAGEPPYLYVVVETSPGIYKHVGMGLLEQAGSFASGLFNYACRWSYDPLYISNVMSTGNAVPFDTAEDNLRRGTSLQVRGDSDSISPRWYDGNTLGNRLAGGFRNSSNLNSVLPLVLRGTSAMTGRNIGPPCLLLGERLSAIYSPLGYPPGIRWARLDNVPPGHQRTYGGVTWIVFPIIRKNGTSGQPNSDAYAYAYRTN